VYVVKNSRLQPLLWQQNEAPNGESLGAGRTFYYPLVLQVPDTAACRLPFQSIFPVNNNFSKKNVSFFSYLKQYSYANFLYKNQKKVLYKVVLEMLT
jgi:hypothetical protein